MAHVPLELKAEQALIQIHKHLGFSLQPSEPMKCLSKSSAAGSGLKRESAGISPSSRLSAEKHRIVTPAAGKAGPGIVDYPAVYLIGWSVDKYN